MESIRIRMYRVGFGDFFLLRFGKKKGEYQFVLIDCGVHAGNIGSIADAVADLEKETAGRISLVVMTHRHADHISGFSTCREAFDGIIADAVWMPVWEDESKPKVHRFWSDLTEVATKLQLHVAATGADPKVGAMLLNATGKTKAKRGGNDDALDCLKNGLGANGSKVTYLTRGSKAKIPPALAKLGLGAQIFGPPALDEMAMMKLMDLKKKSGQYLDTAERQATTGPLEPFGARWKTNAAVYGDAHAFAEMPQEQMEPTLASQTPDMLAAAAKAIDDFLNNESLVILFTFGGKKLLFVGDAQAGNWERWLYDSSDPEKDPDGPLDKAAASILKDIDFYKVGHHGSTNATPIAVVEALGDHVVAMCSTEEKAYGKIEKETEVPRIPLMQALAKKTTLLRSDSIEVTVDGEKVPRGETAAKSLPKLEPKRGRIEKGAFWIDYFL